MLCPLKQSPVLLFSQKYQPSDYRPDKRDCSQVFDNICIQPSKLQKLLYFSLYYIGAQVSQKDCGNHLFQCGNPPVSEGQLKDNPVAYIEQGIGKEQEHGLSCQVAIPHLNQKADSKDDG